MITFVSAGPGDPDLITIKAQKALQNADVVLYTGSLIPGEVLSWCKEDCLIVNSADMDYEEIFAFLLKHKDKNLVRLHTGDVSIYSTLAKQVDFLKQNGIDFTIIPGVTAAFAAAASLGVEYTIPGISQTLILTRVEGKTPNPESIEQLLSNKHSSFAFYLSIRLLKKLKDTALALGYSKDTPCYVVEKASWKDEKIYKGSISTIEEKVSHVKGVALILFGAFLEQKETTQSHLYGSKYKKEATKESKSL